jgi:hypothetical protein
MSFPQVAGLYMRDRIRAAKVVIDGRFSHGAARFKSEWLRSGINEGSDS